MAAMKFELNEKTSLQDFLSIGYIFLLVLGIVKDTIFYGFLDIHILAYSSVLDVLMSPIIFLTKSIYIVVIVVAMVLFLFWYIKQAPKIHKKYRAKKWYQMMGNMEKMDKMYMTPQNNYNQLLTMVALIFVSFFIGAGIGGGEKVADRLKNGEIKMNHELTFHDKEVKKARVIGQNSQYVFYILEGNNRVSISPILGNIVKFERLEQQEEEAK